MRPNDDDVMYSALSDLASIDVDDINLRDHPDAYAILDSLMTHAYAEGRADQAAEAPRWQPIATAPQDGTHILAYFPLHPFDDDDAMDKSIDRGGVVVVTFMAGGWVEPDYMDATGEWFGDDCCYAEAPTLWMPLPAAPVSTGEWAA